MSCYLKLWVIWTGDIGGRFKTFRNHCIRFRFTIHHT
eukprot:SAG11_NODE_3108_length_2682_cov_70.794038_4_plen_36_part_01